MALYAVACEPMRRFRLLEPKSVAEAIEVLAGDEEARPISGGTALLVMMKLGLFIPTTLVNLLKLPGLREVQLTDDGLRIGALASIHDVERHPDVRVHYPVLASACHVVANIRIRNLATIGGNLAHADYQSDPPAALVALDASVELTGPDGVRRLPLEEFLLGTYETALEPGELLTAIRVPPPPPGAVGRYLKFTMGSSEERPSAGIAVLAAVDAGSCRELRVVVGAVGPRPTRLHAAEERARGTSADERLVEEVSAGAVQAVEPIEDLHGSAAYKRRLVGVLTRRALQDCLGLATK